MFPPTFLEYGKEYILKDPLDPRHPFPIMKRSFGVNTKVYVHTDVMTSYGAWPQKVRIQYGQTLSEAQGNTPISQGDLKAYTIEPYCLKTIALEKDDVDAMRSIALRDRTDDEPIIEKI